MVIQMQEVIHKQKIKVRMMVVVAQKDVDREQQSKQNN